VEVHCAEGLANHIGPKPCAGIRKYTGEASAGDRIGQPLSREIDFILGADAVLLGEGNMDRRIIAGAYPARRGRRPWHVHTLFVREPGDLMPDQSGRFFAARDVCLGYGQVLFQNLRPIAKPRRRSSMRL
jgi:hypothetical protein